MDQHVALITGSSQGIGRAIAENLSRSGFAVALNDISHGNALDSAVSDINASGGTAFAAPFDVTNLAVHDETLEKIETELGPITTLVNNAGVGVLSRGDPLEVTEESFDRCIDVNTKAAFFLTQAFAKRVLAGKRAPGLFHSVINVTSSNAGAVAVARAEYCASKAAASMISKCFAVRLGPENIQVYDVQPGLIETPMTAPVIDDYKARAAEGLCLMPRVGQADEVGKTVATLATNGLPYTTGQVISVDGGMLVPRF
jgi:3-oxoacyl-[acyl-carrier protein] reductase